MINREEDGNEVDELACEVGELDLEIAEDEGADDSEQPQELSWVSVLSQAAEAATPIVATTPPVPSIWTTANARKKALDDRLKVLMQTDPELSALKSKGFTLEVNTTVRIKAQPGASKLYRSIVEHILTTAGAVKTQTQIQKYIGERYPNNIVPKDWTKPLAPWAVAKLRQDILSAGAPMSTIKLPKVVTLSSLHKAAASAVERHKTGVLTFRPIVQVSDTSVVINGVAFKISQNRVKEKTYRGVRTSMDSLIEALTKKGG